MQPLISTIIPTFNRAHFLGATLDSVLDQTYSNWECIVVDDGSLDFTEELMEFYTKLDKRIRYYHRPENRPKGANVCRNFGFELSKGNYIQWLDSDDLLSKNKIEEQLLQLLENDFSTIATCKWRYFLNSLEEGNIYEDFRVYRSFDKISEFIDAMALSGGFLPAHSYLVSRELIHQAGNWMENLDINQDGEFFARIFIKAKRVVFINNASVYYRRNNEFKVSDLNNEHKVAHVILSWQLIESYFKLNFGESTRLVSISKKYLYLRISNLHPNLIKRNQLFFRDEILKNKFSLTRTLKNLIMLGKRYF